jgi:hypothetical protein
MSTSPATPAPVKSAKPPRKPTLATTPATGTFRWAVQPTESHPGCLVITTTDSRTGKPKATAYLVHPVLDNGRLVGWTLKKADGKLYDLPADLSSCDCPDGTYHPERPEGGCKHRKALDKALQALAG